MLNIIKRYGIKYKFTIAFEHLIELFFFSYMHRGNGFNFDGDFFERVQIPSCCRIQLYIFIKRSFEL
jgi:hypothetical protein